MSTSKQVSQDIESFQSDFPQYDVISSSTTEVGENLITLARSGVEKRLIIGAGKSGAFPQGFQGEKYNGTNGGFLICALNHTNATALRSLCSFTSPITLGNDSSFGFGDRLGNAGPAHLKALMDSESIFKPIMAQQSIRELDRTGRTAEDVMDAATWAVFQWGYKGGFGSDADHLKTTEDIDRMARAGFTMFTIDPSEFVDNRSQSMNEAQLNEAFHSLPWSKLNDDPDLFLRRYTEQSMQFGENISFKPSKIDILRAAVKYGRVIIHAHEMFRYLRETYPDRDTEVELSIDETPYPTTPEEHLVIASELERMEVDLVSLAPRFCGDFEKGIDFKGDLDLFSEEYVLHQAIASKFGEYKLSIHSGSDKFSVYEAIGNLDVGNVHVKTAGTSYLEALRAVAICDASLFRELMAFSLRRFDTDRKTYHISANVDRMKNPDDYTEKELPELLDDDNARQILHVTFGSVLAHQPGNNEQSFGDRIRKTLSENEEVYEDCLYRHFRKHIRPFEKV